MAKRSGLTPGLIRPNGRSTQVRIKVFDAALAVLAESGYAACTIDNVAECSGVHKTTIYRRWRTKEAVLAAAVDARVDSSFPIPATGSIAEDLRQFGRMVVDFLTDTSPQVSGIVRALFSDAAACAPEIAEIKKKFLARRHQAAAVMVSAAIEKGELDPAVNSRELVGLVAAALYYRKLVTEEPLNYSVADSAVDAALIAVRNGAFRRS